MKEENNMYKWAKKNKKQKNKNKPQHIDSLKINKMQEDIDKNQMGSQVFFFSAKRSYSSKIPITSCPPPASTPTTRSDQTRKLRYIILPFNARKCAPYMETNVLHLMIYIDIQYIHDIHVSWRTNRAIPALQKTSTLCHRLLRKLQRESYSGALADAAVDWSLNVSMSLRFPPNTKNECKMTEMTFLSLLRIPPPSSHTTTIIEKKRKMIWETRTIMHW